MNYWIMQSGFDAQLAQFFRGNAKAAVEVRENRLSSGNDSLRFGNKGIIRGIEWKHSWPSSWSFAVSNSFLSFLSFLMNFILAIRTSNFEVCCWPNFGLISQKWIWKKKCASQFAFPCWTYLDQFERYHAGNQQ